MSAIAARPALTAVWIAAALSASAMPGALPVLLGHAHLGTTDAYLSRPRIDDIVAAVRDLSYEKRTNVLGVAETLKTALEATTGIEPV